MNERRRSTRLELESKLFMKRLDNQQSEEVDIKVFDLSKTGVGFHSNKKLTIGAIYDISLLIWTKEVIHTCVQIVRMEEKGADLSYGATFVGITETDQARIETYQTVQRFEK